MAHLFQKPRSPYWWISYTDPRSRERRRESTGLRVGVGPDRRAARQLEAERTAAERTSAGCLASERWGVWVDDFFRVRYLNNPKSLLRYRTAWRTLVMFLDEFKILTPRQLTRAHCFAYFGWRDQAEVGAGKYRAGHNTALLELKLLGLVMKEAVQRGFAPANPARELGLKRGPVRKPCEFTDADLLEIERSIATEPEPRRSWLFRSFAIAQCHGVRLEETLVNPMVDVWEVRSAECGVRSAGCADFWAIRFHQKGGKVRVKPLHPELFQLFQELRQQKAVQTFERPKSFAKQWHNFFKRHGIKQRLPNACFHSFRVTVENKLRRAGIEKALRMEYLSHESRDVNAGYDRFTLDELRACHSALASAECGVRSAE